MAGPFLIKWTKLGDVLVAYSTGGDMPQDAWDAFMGALGDPQIRKVCAFATGDVNMTSVQRNALGQLAKRRGLRTAVLTDARLARGIVTAVSWLGVDVKAFAPAEFARAAEYLELDDALRRQLQQAAEDLRRSIEREHQQARG